MRSRKGLSGFVSIAIHCLSGSRPWASYGATRSGFPLCVVIHCFAFVLPCGRTAAEITSAATEGLGSRFLLTWKLCESPS